MWAWVLGKKTKKYCIHENQLSYSHALFTIATPAHCSERTNTEAVNANIRRCNKFYYPPRSF